jgi:hypothetical protein
MTDFINGYRMSSDEDMRAPSNSKSEDTLDEIITEAWESLDNIDWHKDLKAKINRLMLEARLAGAIDCATWVMQHDESSFRQERAWFKVKPALFLKYQAELLKELQELSNNLKEDR